MNTYERKRRKRIANFMTFERRKKEAQPVLAICYDFDKTLSPEEMWVPFRNMVYIGDSDTDIPCMKLVNAYGGHI